MTGISQVDIIKNSVQKSYVEPYSSLEIEDISKHTITDYPIEYPDTICAECGNNHSFRGNFEDATTLIDLLPELFPKIFKSNRSSSSGINKLQEFEN